MEPRYIHEVNPYVIGSAYMSLNDDIRSLLDSLIASSNAKISVIRFLRAHLGIGLVVAKNLYEARHEHLTKPANPYGW